MTLRTMMKKVETYNELAELMNGRKAHITLIHGIVRLEGKTYKELAKKIRDEYVKELADAILKADNYEIDEEAEINWLAWGYKEKTSHVETALYANF